MTWEGYIVALDQKTIWKEEAPKERDCRKEEQ